MPFSFTVTVAWQEILFVLFFGGQIHFFQIAVETSNQTDQLFIHHLLLYSPVSYIRKKIATKSPPDLVKRERVAHFWLNLLNFELPFTQMSLSCLKVL